MRKKSTIVFILLLVLKNVTWISFFAAFLFTPFHGHIEGNKEAYFSYLGPFWEACCAAVLSVLTGALLFIFAYYFFSSCLTPKMTAVFLLCDAGWLAFAAVLSEAESALWLLSRIRMGIQLLPGIFLLKKTFFRFTISQTEKGLWLAVRISLTVALASQIISQIYMMIKANNAVISNGAPAVICCLAFFILCFWIPLNQTFSD